jgi:hypothetical protein
MSVSLLLDAVEFLLNGMCFQPRQALLSLDKQAFLNICFLTSTHGKLRQNIDAAFAKTGQPSLFTECFCRCAFSFIHFAGVFLLL